jgi:hypothetical protein
LKLRKLSIAVARQLYGKRKGKINIVIAFPYRENGEWYMRDWYLIKLPF